MRRDMKRLLIERPRVGCVEPRYPRQRAKAANPELFPQREGMRRRYFYTKLFSDYLSPLERFLRSRLGRPWDRVYSEIRASCDHRSLDGHHLFQHVAELVRLAGDPSRLRHGMHAFYVDSRGFLREHLRARRRNERKADPNVIEVDPGIRYERINGCWFACKQEPRPELRSWNGMKGPRETRPADEGDVLTWKKRQLGKRELAKLGLSNQPEWASRSEKARAR